MDDIVILSRREDSDERDQLVKDLKNAYEIRQIGDLKWFLNMRIICDRPNLKLWLCQDAYIDKIVDMYHLAHACKAYTPLTGTLLEPFNEPALPAKIHHYQQCIGSCIYSAVMTRPDITYAVGKLATFMTNPSEHHSSEADRMISYLRDTKNLAIQYNGNVGRALVLDLKPDVVEAASDASFADNPDRRSTQGYIFKLFGGAVDWKSNRQTIVTTSTTEAELVAISQAGKESIWWDRFFRHIQFEPGHKIRIQCNNRQTVGILMKEDPSITTKLRHVDIYGSWLRERVQSGDITVDWVPTAQMPADGFTKALPRQKHSEFVKMLGLVDISDIITAQAK